MVYFRRMVSYVDGPVEVTNSVSGEPPFAQFGRGAAPSLGLSWAVPFWPCALVPGGQPNLPNDMVLGTVRRHPHLPTTTPRAGSLVRGTFQLLMPRSTCSIREWPPGRSARREDDHCWCWARTEGCHGRVRSAGQSSPKLGRTSTCKSCPLYLHL